MSIFRADTGFCNAEADRRNATDAVLGVLSSGKMQMEVIRGIYRGLGEILRHH